MKPLTESGANARDARLSYAPQRVTKAVPAPANERKVWVQDAAQQVALSLTVHAPQSMIPVARHSIGPSRRPSEGTALRNVVSAQPRTSMGYSSRQSLAPTAGRPSMSRCADHGHDALCIQAPYRARQPYRRSSVYGDRGTVKDTRPLSDKEYRKQCCLNLIRFLSANGTLLLLLHVKRTQFQLAGGTCALRIRLPHFAQAADISDDERLSPHLPVPIQANRPWL